MKIAGIGLLILVFIPLAVGILGGSRTVIALAASSNNTALCRIIPQLEKVEMKVSPGLSENDCYREVAVKNNNPKACELTPFDGYCYQQVAALFGDVSICERIKAADIFRGACYEPFMREQDEILICEDLKDSNSKSACYMYYVQHVEPANQTICDKNVTNGLIEYRDFCYFFVAREKKNAKICEKIVSPIDKKVCQVEAAARRP